jgi:hypothetical protein
MTFRVKSRPMIKLSLITFAWIFGSFLQLALKESDCTGLPGTYITLGQAPANIRHK